MHSQAVCMCQAAKKKEEQERVEREALDKAALGKAAREKQESWLQLRALSALAPRPAEGIVPPPVLFSDTLLRREGWGACRAGLVGQGPQPTYVFRRRSSSSRSRSGS